MPAASAKKRARQCANRLLQKEAETSTPSDILPPAESVKPAPTSFTITYSPVSISYPEPTDPAAQLPTDAIRVTRDQLMTMLQQSYIHGSEDRWKTHFELANKRLRASYEQDMQDAATAFAENERLIREEAYDRGFEYGMDGCEAQLASLQESLTAKYDMQHLSTLTNMSERCQESHKAGIQKECERWELARASQPSVATQTIPFTTSSISIQTECLLASTPTMTTASIQTNSPSFSPSSTVTISTQTEPLLPIISESSEPPTLIPITISEPPIPSTSDSASFDWGNDTLSLSTLPMIPLRQPHDLLCLHSSSKNPFSSLHRRQRRYRKHSQIRSSHATPSHPPPHHTPPLLNNSLDWHHDPRLFELSRVLRTLGWSHP